MSPPTTELTAIQEMANAIRHGLDVYDQDPNPLRTTIENISSNEFADTQLGQLMIVALQDYGNQSIGNRSYSPSERAETPEARRRKKREFIDFLLAVADLQNQWDRLNEQFNDTYQAFTETLDTFQNKAQAIQQEIDAPNRRIANMDVNGITDKILTNIPEDQRRKQHRQAITDRVNNIDQARSHYIRAHQSRKDLSAIVDRMREDPNVKPMDLAIKTQELMDASRTEIEGFFAMRANITDLVTYCRENEIELNNEVRTIFQSLSDDMQKLEAQYERYQDLMDQEGALLEEQRQEMERLAAEMDRIAQQLHQHAQNPALQENDEARRIIQSAANNYAQASQSIQASTQQQEELQSQIADLQEIQRLLEPYKGLDRIDFLAERRGENWWERHFGNNLFKNYLGKFFDINFEDEHVQTQDGDVVFCKNGQYYYYPDNAENAERVYIRDPEQIRDILNQAWRQTPPKFFGNDTSYANKFEQENAGQNALAVARGGADITQHAAYATQTTHQIEQQLAQASPTTGPESHTVSPQTPSSGLSVAEQIDPTASSALGATFATAAQQPSSPPPSPTPSSLTAGRRGQRHGTPP